MADTRTLPHVRQALVGAGGTGTQPWLAWFQRINDAVTSGAIGTESADASIAAIATALGATDGTVGTIPALDFSNTLSGDTLALGLRSVQHYGSLSSGMVSFDLVGDEDAPGNTYAYGTTGAGVRGWRSIASAFTSPGNITLTVGADGVTAVDLADLANAGGGTLQKTARDAKGRLAGTSAATTTDLTEGTNLYHTDARAQAAVVIDSIADADTTHAPSRNAVFDALAGKLDQGTGTAGGTVGPLNVQGIVACMSSDSAIDYGGFAGAGSTTQVFFGNLGAVKIRPAGRTTASGIGIQVGEIFPEVDNTVDLGFGTSLRWKNCRIAGAYFAGTSQVVGARDTGWAAMTGTAIKTTIAAAAAGTASAAYVQAEAQSMRNRIAALEGRMKAYDAALIAHGLIGT